MAIYLNLAPTVDKGPRCFKNFYDYHKNTLVTCDNYFDCLNELLTKEPCIVKYAEYFIVPGRDGIRFSRNGRLEFATNEDYATFILRWG